MNQLNSPNLEEAIISALQKILTEDPNFFLTDRLSVLTWKSKKLKGALVTRVGNLRYLGMLRKDSKGQDYWKYKPLSSEKSGGESAIQPNSASVENREEQRQAIEESEQVKKFREKYGEFSAKKNHEKPNQSQNQTS